MMTPGNDDASELINRLFPFHVEIAIEADRAPIVSVGERVHDWLGDVVGRNAADCFALVRPHLRNIGVDAVAKLAGQVLFVEHVPTGRRLRGELVPLTERRLLFVGSPLVTAEDKIENLGLRLSDFAPHDATADIVIMAQFTDLQIGDIERQQASIAELAEVRDELDATASTDPLTGVANRRALWAAWEATRRIRGESALQTLLYIDVDGFKQVNDEHGHHVGDQVLKVLADRMRKGVKARDLVGRLGGDEFVILFDELPENAAIEVADRVRASLLEPIVTGIGLIEVSASMGLARAQLSHEIDEAIRDADTAMYRGRQSGRGLLTIFDPAMGQEREERRVLTHDLNEAVESGEGLVAWYQPIVEVESGAVVGFEALARWFHPERGLIRPDIFIGIAEAAGLIDQLDELILDQALEQLARWHERSPELTLHANVSGRSLSRNTAPQLSESLRNAGVHPRHLVVEVTESWFIDHHRIEILQAIANLGVGLQLDDFGTGFSSMTHLQSFPIDGLKVDRSFVGGIADNDRDRRLVEATLSMARSLQLDVVAEGVETEEIASVLSELDCRFAQGYLYSPPVPASDAGDLLGVRGLRAH